MEMTRKRLLRWVSLSTAMALPLWCAAQSAAPAAPSATGQAAATGQAPAGGAPGQPNTPPGPPPGGGPFGGLNTQVGWAPGGAPPATPPGRLPADEAAAKAARTLAPYFKPATAAAKAPDADGFLERWLLLEPINKPNRSNTVFTGSYVRAALNTEYFPNQFSVVPHDGDKLKVGDQELAWHALDSANYDAKLFRFAYGLNKPTYGVIFWAVTVVNSPREMKNVRLAAGSNSASMWWLNGEDVVNLFDDRRMAMDDVVSKPLMLNKGKNILRGAVINGPGLSDFCLRFVDEKGEPVKDLTLTLQ